MPTLLALGSMGPQGHMQSLTHPCVYHTHGHARAAYDRACVWFSTDVPSAKWLTDSLLALCPAH